MVILKLAKSFFDLFRAVTCANVVAVVYLTIFKDIPDILRNKETNEKIRFFHNGRNPFLFNFSQKMIGL